MWRTAGIAASLMALPGAAACSGIPLPTCEDTGAGTQAMLLGRAQGRFVHFVEGRTGEPAGLAIHVSRLAIADCRAGWRLSAPADDDAARELMHEVFHGETAYDRRGILRLAGAQGVALREELFDAGHCTCKLEAEADTHLVDD